MADALHPLKEVSHRLLFLSLIGLMLFVLAIAGQDGSPLAKRLTGASVARVMNAMDDRDDGIPNPREVAPNRAPASFARTLDIEPVAPGTE